MTTAFIIDGIRTPRAKKKGKFSAIHPADLLTYPLTALTKRHRVEPKLLDDVIVGCVTQTAEQGWCVGRKAVLAAGFPDSVPATTVNRLCASGQQACTFAASGVLSGAYSLAIGAGVEHMTRVPMFSDGGGEESKFLVARYPDLVPQGLAAELVCEAYKLTRQEVDAYSAASQHRAGKALEQGFFSKSIVPVPYVDEQDVTKELRADDTARPTTTLEALAGLKPAFKEGGLITAGNSSAIVDGAAAMLFASEEAVERHALTPRGRIVATHAIGSPPKIMLTGPIAASREILAKAKLSAKDIDLWEINEAFAPVPLATMRELGLDHSQVNVHGGGISLGHPLGATGVMLMITALDELERRKGRYALVTMCIGLGMACATIIERL